MTERELLARESILQLREQAVEWRERELKKREELLAQQLQALIKARAASEREHFATIAYQQLRSKG